MNDIVIDYEYKAKWFHRANSHLGTFENCHIDDCDKAGRNINRLMAFKNHKSDFPDKHQQRCLKSWINENVPFAQHLTHAAMGLVSEAGEFAGVVDKSVFKPSATITREMMLDELGDIWYYVVMACYVLHVTVDQLDQMNADKLAGGHGWVKT